MKKWMMICLALVLVLSMSLTAFAATGGFVVSPSNNKSPRVSFSDWDSDECTAELVITPYAERDTLDAEGKAAIEDAYDDIKGSADLTNLCDGLGQLAEQMDIRGDALAVSDLFDIDYTGCDKAWHEQEHGKVSVGLEADTLDDFVGLMIYVDGKWQMVEDAKVENGVLTFSTDVFGPMAIVVEREFVEPPKTGDTSQIELWAILAGVSAVAIVVCVVLMTRSRKRDRS